MRSSSIIAAAFLFSACASIPAPSASRDTLPAEHTEVIMNTDGFSPASVSLMAGDTVCWMNEHAGEARWPASNDHPTHEEYAEFDPQTPVRDGNHWCFTFSKPGSWVYHDHLFPEFRGTVVVK